MAKDLWKDAEFQLKELDMDLEEEGGKNPWDAAAQQEVRMRRRKEGRRKKNADDEAVR